MDLSIRERLIQALMVALNAGAQKPASTYRTRVAALEGKELPAYVLYPLESAPERKGPGITYHELTLRLECLIQGEPPLDQALDPLLVYAWQTLWQACDALGQVKGLEEAATQWEIEPAYDDVAVATLDFRVTFATAAGDPTVER